MNMFASKLRVAGVFVGISFLLAFAIFLTFPTCSFRNTSSLVKLQRNRISAQLDSALQRLGQLECQLSKNKGEVSGTGGWCEKFSKGNSIEHKTDLKLAKALVNLFRGQTVASFGDGPGEYKAHVDASTAVRKYDAYDGAPPFVEQVTNGSVRHLDLSVERFGLPVYDWVLSLEVVEHIPVEYEDAFLSNIVRHALKGVVLSWAVPGQDGFHHVNLRPIEYVLEKMSQLGFIHDHQTSANLQQHSTFKWFQRNVNVFRTKKEVKLDVDQA